MWKIILTLTIALGGCRAPTAPVSHEFQKSWNISSTFDLTWEATIELFADRGWSISALEKDSGIISTDWARINNTDGYADCGDPGSMSASKGHQVKFNVFIKRDSDSNSNPLLTVNCMFRDQRVFNYIYYVDCYSTGILEDEIHSQILGKLK